MTWEKLPVLKSAVIGCGTCGYTPSRLSLESRIFAGFGYADVKKDGVIVYEEQPDVDFDKVPTLQKFENMARKDPDHDWRVHFNLPLREAEYQRQGPNTWMLVKTGMGFA